MTSQVVSNATKTISANASDSCTWYSGERCTQPRTGYDCLNVLLDTDECVIGPNGACYLTDREYYEPLSRYFPASNYTYCSANDSVCSTCVEEWTINYETTGSAGATTFCTGSDGCVCVAATEVPSWEQTVIANQCDASSNSSQEFSSGTRICIILALCVSGVMVLAVFAMRRCIRTGTRTSGSAHHPPSGPQLSLTGWKSLREKLIETEHTFVNGDTARLDTTARSAEALAEAPTVTVEVCTIPVRRPETPPSNPQYMMAPIAIYVEAGTTRWHEEDVRRCTTKVQVSEEEQVAMATSSSSNGSSSLEAEVTAPSNVSTRDSCAWYVDESCESSRTCYDCLNVGIVGDSCAVGDIGQCLSVSKQVEGKTYYFASSATYCAVSDEVCATCRARWLQEYATSGEVQSSAVCMGENGCVCLAVCERETRNSVVIQHECPAYERARVGSIMLVIAMGVAAFIVFSMITFCLKKLLRCGLPWLDQDPSDQSMLARRRPPRSPRGPQLSLSGWKSMREKLIETEHGNGTPSAGPSGVMRIQLSATEGTSVIVEEGEGYRPDSPSEYHRHGPEDVAPALAMLR